MIETELSEKQRLLLWRLAVAGGGMWLSDIAGGLGSKPLRDGLIYSQLISEEKRERKIPGKRTTRPLFVTLEDRGWAWLGDHMQLSVWKSKTASDVLQGLLSQLRDFMDRQQFALGDVLSNSASASDLSSGTDHPDMPVNGTADLVRFELASVRQEIASAYARLASNQSNSRVRLAALRQELSGLTRSDLDCALREMLYDGEIVLNRLDNPAEITPEDEAAMIKTSIGDPRHIMHMEVSVGRPT